jgi:hypothetical protein
VALTVWLVFHVVRTDRCTPASTAQDATLTAGVTDALVSQEDERVADVCVRVSHVVEREALTEARPNTSHVVARVALTAARVAHEVDRAVCAAASAAQLVLLDCWTEAAVTQPVALTPCT